MIKAAQVLAQKLLYGGNVIFLYYIPNREMINYSHVPLDVFTNHFRKTSCEILAQASRTKVPPLTGRVCGFETLIFIYLFIYYFFI